MNAISLQNRYHAVNNNTVALWAENAGIGKVREENYYDPTRPDPRWQRAYGPP